MSIPFHSSFMKGLIIMRENEKVRKAARAAGVPFWKIANAMNVSEPTMTRWLRSPLQEEKEKKILETIEVLEKEGG